jgi:hypothetical protein
MLKKEDYKKKKRNPDVINSKTTKHPSIMQEE